MVEWCRNSFYKESMRARILSPEKTSACHTFLAFAFDWIINKTLFYKHILMDMKLKHRSFRNVSFYYSFRRTLRKIEEYHLACFEKAKIFTLTNVYNFGFYQTSNEKVCLTKRNKEKQRKIITYSWFYWSFRSCSFKNINKTDINRF